MKKRSSHLPSGISSINIAPLCCLCRFREVDFKMLPTFQTACCDKVGNFGLLVSPHLCVLCPLHSMGPSVNSCPKDVCLFIWSQVSSIDAPVASIPGKQQGINNDGF